MKKSILLFIVAATAFGAVLTGCKTKTTCIECKSTVAENEDLYVGNYNGTVTLNVTVAGAPVPVTINTTFAVSKDPLGGLKITSSSIAGGAFNIKATVNSGDCKAVTMTPIAVDTLKLTNLPNPLAGIISNYQPLNIIDFAASGVGSLDCDGKKLAITLTITKGTTQAKLPGGAIINGLDVSNTTFSAALTKL